MADIDAVRKTPTVWPWILGLLVLALLIWAMAELLGGDEPEIIIEDLPRAASAGHSAPR